MKKGKKSRQARKAAPSHSSGDAAVSRHPRAADQLHVLTPRHLELFDRVSRARPDLRPLFDLRQFEAGCESIEELSRRAHGHMVAKGLDPQLFSALCELNAERVLDAIARHLDEEGLPLDEQALLGELYARLHRWYFERGAASPFQAAAEESARFGRMGRDTTVMRGLADVARQIVAERVRMLLATSVPVANAPAPAVAVADSLVVDAARHLTARRLRLRATDLRRWVTFALLTLPGVERRLIHLRCRRDFSVGAIADQLGLAPFEAGIRLRRAIGALHDEIERLLRRHEFNDTLAEDAPEQERPPGRLIELRPTTPATTPRAGAKEPATDAASSEREGADDE